MSDLLAFVLVFVIAAVIYVAVLLVVDAWADRRRRRTRVRIVQEEHQRATAAQVFKEHGPGGAS